MNRLRRRVSTLERAQVHLIRRNEDAALRLLTDEELDRRLTIIVREEFGDDVAAFQDFQRETVGFVLWPEPDFGEPAVR